MKKLYLNQLRQLIEQVPTQLRQLSEESLRDKPQGRWSGIEILGHLCDSAANNHQRFVRAMQVQPLEFQDYDQNQWVAIEQYQNLPTDHVLTFWIALNRQLFYVISAIPEDELLERTCKVGEGENMTLIRLLAFYLEHLQHHLTQLGVNP